MDGEIERKEEKTESTPHHSVCIIQGLKREGRWTYLGSCVSHTSWSCFFSIREILREERSREERSGEKRRGGFLKGLVSNFSSFSQRTLPGAYTKWPQTAGRIPQACCHLGKRLWKKKKKKRLRLISTDNRRSDY